MITKAEVLMPLVSLVLGAITLEEFHLKFAALSYNIYKNGTPEAIEAADIVESRLALLYLGEIPRDSFVFGLRKLVNYAQSTTHSLAYIVSNEGTFLQMQN